MKNKLKSKLILLFIVLASLFVFGGCTLGESKEDAIANRDLVASVTYYANGGKFDSTPDKTEIYYPVGAKPYNVAKKSTVSGTITLTRNRYDFDGWYYAVDKDGDGIPDTDSNSTEQNPSYVIDEDNRVDFEKIEPLKEGDALIFVAKWLPKVTVEVRLVCDPDVEITGKVDGKDVTLSNYDATNPEKGIIKQLQYGTNSAVSKPRAKPFSSVEGEYTFTEYYVDSDCTTLVKWPIQLKDGQEENEPIYAKYITGTWTVVSTADQATEMLNSSTGRYWLVKDVNLGGATVGARATRNSDETYYSAEIQGNGFTLSNFIVQKTSIEAGYTVSLFGKIGESAIIENLTLADVSFTYSIKSSPTEIYVAFTSLHSGAKITNVRILGQITVTGMKDKTTNFDGDSADEYKYESCLFGGYKTDAEYLAENPNGFKVGEDGQSPNEYIDLRNYL